MKLKAFRCVPLRVCICFCIQNEIEIVLLILRSVLFFSAQSDCIVYQAGNGARV